MKEMVALERVSTRRSLRMRPACTKALLPAALMAGALLIGCGSSSSGKAASSSARSTPTPARQRATQAATAPAPVTSASHGTTAQLVSGSSGDVSATLLATTHQPKVSRPWPIHFIVTRAGRPARAAVSYEYLFDGAVVAHRSHYTFTGRFSDVFQWPASAVGYPLTFRAVVTSGTATINLDYAVRVSK